MNWVTDNVFGNLTRQRIIQFLMWAIKTSLSAKDAIGRALRLLEVLGIVCGSDLLLQSPSTCWLPFCLAFSFISLTHILCRTDITEWHSLLKAYINIKKNTKRFEMHTIPAHYCWYRSVYCSLCRCVVFSKVDKHLGTRSYQGGHV